MRFGYILIGHNLEASEKDFDFGFEMGRIGRSLAQGQGFSNPFNETTGPTAWEPPLYPFLIAGVFRVFGVYSRASAIVLLSINSIFSALTCIPIFLIAKKMFQRKGCGVDVLDLGAAAVCDLLVHALGVGNEPGRTVAGDHFLADARDGREKRVEAMAAVWLAVGRCCADQHCPAVIFARFRVVGLVPSRQARQAFAGRSSSRVGSSSPRVSRPGWFATTSVFGKVIFIRSNFGAELRLGNGPGADGTWMDYLHPSKNVLEMRRYQELGELAYVAERKREAMAYIREDYARFAGLSLRRFIYYWGGLPKASNNRGRRDISAIPCSLPRRCWASGDWAALCANASRAHGFFSGWFSAYPLVYYFVFPHPRYRHPIEPELGILIVYVISEVEGRDGLAARSRSSND